MLKIGLTGGIGSGKSTIAKIIETLGYPVYISDSKSIRTNQPGSRNQKTFNRTIRQQHLPTRRATEQKTPGRNHIQ